MERITLQHALYCDFPEGCSCGALHEEEMQNSLAFMKEQNAILQKRLDELQDSRVVALQVLQERHAKETIALIEYKGKQCGGISAWQETLLASAYCAIGKLPPNDSILTVK